MREREEEERRIMAERAQFAGQLQEMMDQLRAETRAREEAERRAKEEVGCNHKRECDILPYIIGTSGDIASSSLVFQNVMFVCVFRLLTPEMWTPRTLLHAPEAHCSWRTRRGQILLLPLPVCAL